LLLRVRKILEGGDISGFAPKPSDGERQVVGLSILAGRGVGPKKARNILDRFNVCLVPKDDSYGYDSPVLEDCQGIGPKIAEIIRKNLEVVE
jgi:Holliday junction resolvasome RuvABC DNA-binding subunit